MEDSEEQTKTRLVTCIKQDWEVLRRELETQAMNSLTEENGEWYPPLAMSHIIKEILEFSAGWHNEEEIEADPSVVAARAMNAYVRLQNHNLQKFEKFKEQLLPLLSGGTNGR